MRVSPFAFITVVAALCLVVATVPSASAAHNVLGRRIPSNFPSNWALGERANPSESVRFVIALKQRNLDKLENLFWAVSTPGSPQYREFKSINEISALVAPSKESIKAILSWLSSNGVSSGDILLGADFLELTTTVNIAETLFHTQINTWTHVSGKTLLRIVGEWGLDSDIASLIDFVEGLLDFPLPKYSLKRSSPLPSPLATPLVSICPQSIRVLYKVPTGTVATGNTSICPAEWDDQYYNPDHLQAFAKSFGEKIAPIAKDHIYGHNDPNRGGGESTLDVEYVAAVSSGATTWYWVEGSGAWLYTYAVHAFNNSQLPLIFSISYGWSEAQQCAKGIGSEECSKLGVNSTVYVNRVNTEFQKIGLRGVSLIVASGDSGANGRTDPDCTGTILHPDFPAASPFVTAVGATQITRESGVAKLPNPPRGCDKHNCASAGTEVAVSYEQAQFASGGGFSWVAPTPTYQSAAVAGFFATAKSLPPKSYFNAKGRGYPDVAAFGSNVLEEESSIQPVGGTSASAPIFSGLMAIINGYVNEKSGKPLGFLNPLLYKMAATQPNTFNDITVGDNKCTEDGCDKKCQGYEAQKGWDPVSGLGSPVFANIQSFIEKKVIPNKFD